MKITDLKIEAVRIPLKAPIKIAFATPDMLECVMLTVLTDDGLEGYGEASPFAPVTGETVESTIAALNIFKKGLIGMNPFDIEAIHAMMDRLMYGNGSAKCAVDLAMYDLMGKAAGVPVYKLLGGYSNKVLNDNTIGIDTPEKMAEKARAHVDAGYTIIKIKAGIDYRDDIKAMKAIREAVGPNIRLRADANQGYSVSDAVTALEGFKPYGVEAVEQCLPYWDFEGSAYVRRKVSGIKIMLDESIHSPLDAARAARLEAADILNIKLMKCGGLYPALQINAIAQANGMTCMVGCMMETRLGIAAGLSLVASQKNITEADCDSFNAFKGEPVTGGFVQDGGMFTLLDEPGLGVQMNL